MDARNISSRTLDLPTVGVYGVQPGETILGKAGQYAPLVRPDLIQGLLHQEGTWEAADDEATEWAKANPPRAVDAEAELRARRNATTKLQMRPEMVGLIPMPGQEPDTEAPAEVSASRIQITDEPEKPAKPRRRGATDQTSDKE